LDTPVETLMNRFREFLLQAETPTDPAAAGLEQPPPEPDLYSLLSELAALKAEVKKESRQQKEAIGHFNTLLETLQSNNQQLTQELGQQQQARQEAVFQAQSGLLAEIIDLQERLAITADSIRHFAPPRWERKTSRKFRISQLEGLEITLRRLEQLLESRGVTPVVALGKPMDPHTMRVVGVRTDLQQADGLVLEEVRRGYFYRGKPFRPAEVIANRHHSPPPTDTPH